MMEDETRSILKDSVQNWACDQQALIDALEDWPCTGNFPESLFSELNSLGWLDVLADDEIGLDLLAEIACQLARHSPAIALIVVQQNMAEVLLQRNGAPRPSGWVALPLFDGVAEWSTQLRLRTTAKTLRLDGRWEMLSLLPVAESLLLPLCQPQADEFRLLQVPLTAKSRKSVRISDAILTLGLHGCPTADIHFSDATIRPDQILMEGDQAADFTMSLWSRAEVCMMAIRAGIFAGGYGTALGYAKERYQGGKIIINHSLIQKMLSDLYREHCAMDETWRAMAARLATRERLSDGELARVINSAERLPWAMSDALQLLGGVGYMEDFPQARRYRDAKQCEFLLGHPQAKSFAMWKTELR